MIVWTSVTMAKDHVQWVFGIYILILPREAAGAAFAYPSGARDAPVSRRNEGSKEPPKREARDP